MHPGLTVGGRRAGPSVRLSVLLTLTVLVLPAVSASAQDMPPPPRDLTRQEMVGRLVDQFERRLVRDLGMDRSQLEAVNEVMTSMRDERRELFHRRRALEQQVKRFAEEGGTDREARRLLARNRAIRADEARIQAEEEARLLEILSPTEVLRFQVLREELNERIRGLQRRPGGSPGRPDSARAPGHLPVL